ncbi:sugar ABC transporter ATP-binding protein (plasmid) [Roseomonas gilardii subsp. gilardii]|uniref:sugar ABC transporter ATP-binding protein n=1 Tax=Roseomonas gilardii TaxID=257708 RepID=UPI001FF93EF9|nr:sugar ABC transporter ATP-binding protein [Roseomonas gilardii]UPG74682.1 sugar ABC transporter ATP-binding protein [Roseomonas gilardii subsp. gilardii]
MTAPLIELRHIGKSFAAVRALDDVSLTIGQGEIHCLAGENGSGKSTLIKVISGVWQPDQGEILIDGQKAESMTPRSAIAHGVQVIYQDFSLFGNLTVAENLALSTELQARRSLVSWRRVRAIAEAATARLGVELDLDALVETLPTAGRQLVAIARALMSDPRLLIMDEPTTALTGREVEALFRVVRDIQSRGIAVLFVSHKMREMLEISERLTVIRSGRVVAAGPIAEFNEAAITRAMTGQDIATEGYRWAGSASVPVLEVNGLGIPGQLQDISLRVMPGEIVGISGLLGSGRTELALALFGMKPGHAGEVRLNGRPVRLDSVQAAIAEGVAYVPEDRLTEGLFLTQTIDRNILATSHERLSRWGVIRRDAAARDAAATIREMAIATPTGDRPVTQLSGGNQQRVVIGRWLLNDPRLLILNGPTVGVDVGSKAGIHRKIRDLARERGLGVLMISDDLPELVDNCNRILVLHRGRLVSDLPAEATDEGRLSAMLGELA